jgi:hypothetical protein
LDAEPESFSPATNVRMHRLLSDLLGPRWNEIQVRDSRGQAARPPNPRRHMLAVLSEHANIWAGEFPSGIWPGHAPDYLAFHGVVSILERSRSLAAFPNLIPQLVSPEGFRHHMTTLGFADHISQHTQYSVGLPSANPAGSRVVDMVLGPEQGDRILVETKTPREFDGAVAHLTRPNVLGALSRAWSTSVAGPTPQLPRDRPGVLLLGGLTMRVETLPVFDEVARDWLSRRGSSHPYLWGVIAQTFWTYTITPPGRTRGDGATRAIDGRMGVQLRMVENPFYTGIPRLVPAPYATY